MTVQRALPRHLWWAMVSYLLVVVLTAALGLAGSDLLSAVRAYVGGESLWAKGHKEALDHLDRYARHHDPADYLRYEAALAVPLGDRLARIELSRPDPDVDAARAGLLQGGNHPDDIPSMVTLFRRFKDVGPMAEAIAVWAEADAEIDALRSLGERMRAQVNAGRGASPEMRALAQQLPSIDMRLSLLERQFAQRLGEASRAVQQLIVWTTVALTVLLAALGLAMCAWLFHQQLAAERALREGNERWALAAEAAGIGVFDWDVAGDRVMLDARAADLAGVEAPGGAADGQALAGSQLHPDDRERVRHTLNQAIDRGESVAVRFRVQPGGAALRHIELRARVRAHGRQPRMIGILRDVSQDTLSERMRLDKEAAERANRAKGEFLSRVSHELRTPLNAVLGFAQLMHLDPAEPLPPSQAQRVQHVIQSGRHLLELINDMLDVTSIEAGTVRLATEPVALAPLATRCLERLATLAADQRVRLLPPAAADHLRVLADPRRLEQVIVNLVSNAIKYNRPGGEVHVVVSTDGREVVTAVHDTGLGMTADQLGQLFQPFNRLGAEYSKVVGSGLGLVITRQLVTLMGGTVAASSRPGEGSTFIVRLPRAPEHPAPA